MYGQGIAATQKHARPWLRGITSYGRQLRNALPIPAELRKMQLEWQKDLERREEALAKRHIRQLEQLREHTKGLLPLPLGTVVSVQNQTGTRPTHWDKTGIIVEALPYKQYNVKLHGSGRIMLRNRQHLRRIQPFTAER